VVVDELLTSSEPTRRVRLLHLGLVVLANAAFNFMSAPFEGNDAGSLIMMGVVFLQPSLFAIWAALGPPPSVQRWPATIAALVFVAFAETLTQNDRMDREYAIIVAGFFLITSVVMTIVSIPSKLRLDLPRPASSSDAQVNQFSLKYMMTVTTVCALFLGLGRVLTGQQDAANANASWINSIGEMVGPIGLIMLVMFPAILLPLLVLSQRPRRAVIFAFPIAWLCLSWLAVEVIITIDQRPRSDIAKDVFYLQLGAAISSTLSAIVLRHAGYRLLIRRGRRGAPNSRAAEQS
jgi:hypothetical protein